MLVFIVLVLLALLIVWVNSRPLPNNIHTRGEKYHKPKRMPHNWKRDYKAVCKANMLFKAKGHRDFEKRKSGR